MKRLIVSILVLLFCSSASASSVCRLLLGSGGFSGSERTMVYLSQQIDSFLGPVKEVLVIPYAQKDPFKPTSTIEKHHLVGDRQAPSIASFKDARAAVNQAQAFLVWGGNTFRLLKGLYDNDLIELIKARVMAGVPYIGISAGTNVATPSIRTTNDMPIAQPKSLDAIGLIPFQINPHYFSGSIFWKNAQGAYEKYAGETRDERIDQFHEDNEADVLGIPEATFLIVENGKIIFLSLDPTTARLFRKGQASVDLPSQTDITEDLRPSRDPLNGKH